MQFYRDTHTLPDNIGNSIDPDDGNRRVCSRCTLPIFFTPFKQVGELFVHDCCADLPLEFLCHEFHPRGRLTLMENQVSPKNFNSCDKCGRNCGSMMYKCRDSFCDFKLDLLCALQITIMHRSHHHRLMVINASASFMCGACGTQHPGFTRLSYLCKGCDFWIHPDCASLPNAITSLHHPHSLYLAYSLRTLIRVSENVMCPICANVVSSPGVYICVKCGYYAHIKCAVSDPHSFSPESIRDAKFAGLRHFSMADERSSVMRYIMKADTSSEVDQYDSEGEFFRQNLHPHPLIFHNQDSDGESSSVCNTCAQLISSEDPFYSCPECPDFFLHRCCANLPTELNHRNHAHTFSLFPKAPNSSPSGCFKCKWCGKLSNRFGYSCNTCDDCTIDVVCAMMPPSITHHLHPKSHILFTDIQKTGYFYYKCNTCPDFRISTEYTQLPATTNHKFDDHPLKLTAITSRGDRARICEICEDNIKPYYYYYYYYSCSECDQHFHLECVHGFSNFKLGGTIRVSCHDCPLSLIPETTVYGYRCGYCQKVFKARDIEEQKPAYECSKCFFRIHDECAQKCLRKSQDM